MNNISLVGRLTKDPELRTTPNGVAVATFDIAVSRPNTKDKTDFIHIVAWRGTGEFVSKYFRKGNFIGVTGMLTTRDYTDKDGNKRVVYEVVATTAHFTADKKNGAPDVSPSPAGFEQIDDNDDLPFN